MRRLRIRAVAFVLLGLAVLISLHSGPTRSEPEELAAAVSALPREDLKAAMSAADEGSESFKGCIYANGMAFDSLCSGLARRGRWGGPGGAGGGGGASGGGGGPQAGAYGTDSGGICYSSSLPGVGSYTYCGGPGGIGGDTWDAARAVVALADHWPGRYSLQRGEEQARRLDADYQAVKNREQQTTALNDDLRKSIETYVRDVSGPAITSALTTEGRIDGDLAKDLAPILAVPAATQPPAQTTKPDDFAGPVSDAEHRIGANAGDARKQWDDLEDLLRVHNSQAAAGDPLAQADINRAFGKYFDENGVLRPGALGSTDAFSSALSGELRTDGRVSDGQDVRYELNRALLGYGGAGSAEARDGALGAVALAVGADSAFASGDKDDGSELLHLAASATDVAFGLAPIPLVPSANDAIQIVYGMVTGRDYAGNPMSAGDYALRGVGIVLGVCGGECAAVGKEAVIIAGKTLTRAFYRGATLVRDLRLGSYVAGALQPARVVIDEFANVVGGAYSHYHNLAGWIGETSQRVGREISGTADTAARSTAWERRAAEDVNREIGVGIPNYKPAYMADTETFTLTLKSDQKVFRLHGDANQFGTTRTWVLNFDPRGLSREGLADALSLPNGAADVKWISVFDVPPGTVMRGGRVAPTEIYHGGGYQWEVLPRVQEEWVRNKVPFDYVGPL